MSNLHKWIKKHEKMSAEEKENCTCSMCNATNNNVSNRTTRNKVKPRKHNHYTAGDTGYIPISAGQNIYNSQGRAILR